MLDLLPDAVLRLDRAGVVVEANWRASRLTGHPAEELVGAAWVELLDPRAPDGKRVGLDGWHPSVRLRSVRRLPEQELAIRRADARDVTVRATAAYVRDDAGTLQGAVVALRETSRRAAPVATGAEVVSTVSHELRSPLTSVKGYTSLLLRRWERLRDDQKRMMLEQVNHDADRVTRLITELLDISRLEAGRLVLRRQMVDLPALAGRVIAKQRLEYPDLEVTLAFPPGFPAVYADPDKVEQVLTNLVENACKYASPRGLRLCGELGDDEIAVALRDQGPGIGPHDLRRVFTKFFRRSDGRPSGSGLGLWISRGLVEAHGGHMSASSAPGQGSTFRFTLPRMVFEELHG